MGQSKGRREGGGEGEGERELWGGGPGGKRARLKADRTVVQSGLSPHYPASLLPPLYSSLCPEGPHAAPGKGIHASPAHGPFDYINVQ